MTELAPDEATALRLDAADPLRGFRDRFHFPTNAAGNPKIYLVGNSLGLAPKTAGDYVQVELDRWATLGVDGHFTGDLAWEPYHQLATDPLAALTGGHADEVLAMSTLTLNLHLLLISFYRPTNERHKILIEEHAFPSDHFLAESQIRQRGFDPATSLSTVAPRPGAETLDPDDILAAITEAGDELALVLLPGVQYFTGQVLPMAEITAAAHAVGAAAGFDLAHAIGNVELALHDWEVDFAAWCGYKYLNGGPGGTAGVFVHRRHVADQSLPKLLGWWGTNRDTRFEMATRFDAIPTVESWQVSNAGILSLAALRAALEIFSEVATEAGADPMPTLRAKSLQQQAYLDSLLDARLAGRVESITPRDPAQRGCQQALRVIAPDHAGRAVFEALETADVMCDWREPNVIRAAPVPLYNSFQDIYRFVDTLDGILT
ncbi:MAG: kynureninase [Acidimicrobiales bacterium]|nr:kynureninase [Acidimicrobiales bacterium]